MRDSKLADVLNTLLQHYGLVSSYLDLTSDLQVALFFAMMKYTVSDPKSRYDYVGSREGSSMIYVFKSDTREMTPYVPHSGLGQLEAQRPLRQSCVVCRSSAYAMNLPASFLRAVIGLDFDVKESELPSVGDLFPNSDIDGFLRALKENAFNPSLVTSF
jgi:FRG domain